MLSHYIEDAQRSVTKSKGDETQSGAIQSYLDSAQCWTAAPEKQYVGQYIEIQLPRPMKVIQLITQGVKREIHVKTVKLAYVKDSQRDQKSDWTVYGYIDIAEGADSAGRKTVFLQPFTAAKIRVYPIQTRTTYVPPEKYDPLSVESEDEQQDAQNKQNLHITTLNISLRVDVRVVECDDRSYWHLPEFKAALQSAIIEHKMNKSASQQIQGFAAFKQKIMVPLLNQGKEQLEVNEVLRVIYDSSVLCYGDQLKKEIMELQHASEIDKYKQEQINKKIKRIEKINKIEIKLKAQAENEIDHVLNNGYILSKLLPGTNRLVSSQESLASGEFASFLNHGLCWVPRCPTQVKNQYIEIQLKKPMRVRYIILQSKLLESDNQYRNDIQDEDEHSWVTTVKLKHKTIYGNWETDGYLEANYDCGSTRICKVLLFTQAVRIYPVEFHQKISLKVDIAVDTRKQYESVPPQQEQYRKFVMDQVLVDDAYYQRHPEKVVSSNQHKEPSDKELISSSEEVADFYQPDVELEHKKHLQISQRKQLRQYLKLRDDEYLSDEFMAARYASNINAIGSIQVGRLDGDPWCFIPREYKKVESQNVEESFSEIEFEYYQKPQSKEYFPWSHPLKDYYEIRFPELMLVKKIILRQNMFDYPVYCYRKIRICFSQGDVWITYGYIDLIDLCVLHEKRWQERDQKGHEQKQIDQDAKENLEKQENIKGNRQIEEELDDEQDQSYQKDQCINVLFGASAIRLYPLDIYCVHRAEKESEKQRNKNKLEEEAEMQRLMTNGKVQFVVKKPQPILYENGNGDAYSGQKIQDIGDKTSQANERKINMKKLIRLYNPLLQRYYEQCDEIFTDEVYSMDPQSISTFEAIMSRSLEYASMRVEIIIQPYKQLERKSILRVRAKSTILGRDVQYYSNRILKDRIVDIDSQLFEDYIDDLHASYEKQHLQFRDNVDMNSLDAIIQEQKRIEELERNRGPNYTFIASQYVPEATRSVNSARFNYDDGYGVEASYLSSYGNWCPLQTWHQYLRDCIFQVELLQMELTEDSIENLESSFLLQGRNLLPHHISQDWQMQAYLVDLIQKYREQLRYEDNAELERLQQAIQQIYSIYNKEHPVQGATNMCSTKLPSNYVSCRLSMSQKLGRIEKEVTMEDKFQSICRLSETLNAYCALQQICNAQIQNYCMKEDQQEALRESLQKELTQTEEDLFSITSTRNEQDFDVKFRHKIQAYVRKQQVMEWKSLFKVVYQLKQQQFDSLFSTYFETIIKIIKQINELFQQQESLLESRQAEAEAEATKPKQGEQQRPRQVESAEQREEQHYLYIKELNQLYQDVFATTVPLDPFFTEKTVATLLGDDLDYQEAKQKYAELYDYYYNFYVNNIVVNKGISTNQLDEKQNPCFEYQPAQKQYKIDEDDFNNKEQDYKQKDQNKGISNDVHIKLMKCRQKLQEYERIIQEKEMTVLKIWDFCVPINSILKQEPEQQAEKNQDQSIIESINEDNQSQLPNSNKDIAQKETNESVQTQQELNNEIQGAVTTDKMSNPLGPEVEIDQELTKEQIEKQLFDAKFQHLKVVDKILSHSDLSRVPKFDIQREANPAEKNQALITSDKEIRSKALMYYLEKTTFYSKEEEDAAKAERRKRSMDSMRKAHADMLVKQAVQVQIERFMQQNNWLEINLQQAMVLRTVKISVKQNWDLTTDWQIALKEKTKTNHVSDEVNEQNLKECVNKVKMEYYLNYRWHFYGYFDLQKSEDTTTMEIFGQEKKDLIYNIHLLAERVRFRCVDCESRINIMLDVKVYLDQIPFKRDEQITKRQAKKIDVLEFQNGKYFECKQKYDVLITDDPYPEMKLMEEKKRRKQQYEQRIREIQKEQEDLLLLKQSLQNEEQNQQNNQQLEDQDQQKPVKQPQSLQGSQSEHGDQNVLVSDSQNQLSSKPSTKRLLTDSQRPSQQQLLPVTSYMASPMIKSETKGQRLQNMSKTLQDPDEEDFYIMMNEVFDPPVFGYHGIPTREEMELECRKYEAAERAKQREAEKKRKVERVDEKE